MEVKSSFLSDSINVSSLDSLTDFLKRPVRIYKTAWAVNSSLNATFDPWVEFFSAIPVKHKLDNFARIRGKLHVRFISNSNGFYMGTLVASYIPLPSYVLPSDTTYTEYLGDQLSVFSSPGTADFVEILQRPHVKISPPVSVVQEMVLPFFYPLDYFPLTGEYNEYPHIGQICLNCLNKLQQLNGGTDSLTVSVYAWMSDVELTLPTSFVSTSSEVKLDTQEGPVAKTASAIFNVSSSLSKIPLLSPYVTPVMAASKLGYSMAKNLGFSRPSDVSTSTRVIQTHLPDMAYVDVADTSEVLALDSQNSLSVSPLIVNLEEDEMDIKNIVSKPSFMITYTVSNTAAADHLIFSCRVRPTFSQFDSTTSGYHHTRLSFCSLPFKFWRGSITYRIEIIASAFHKGKLRVVWDPALGTNLSDGDYFNTAFTDVLDLEKNRVLDFKIPFAHHYPFLEVSNSGVYIQDGLPLAPTIADNGVLNIFVLNPIVCATTSSYSPVYINVYHYSDDMEFFRPCSDLIKNITFISTSGVVDAAEDLSVVTEDIPFVPTTYPSALKANGESVTNIRALTKRFGLHAHRYGAGTALVGGNGLQAVSVFYEDWDRPFYRGPDPNGLYSAGAGKWNFANQSFISWFEPCFVGRRGGYKVRYSYAVFTSNSSGSTVTVMSYADASVIRVTPSITVPTLSSSSVRLSGILSSDYASAYALNVSKDLANATSNLNALDPFAFRIPLQPTFDTSLPYYGNRKFLLARNIKLPSATNPSQNVAWSNAHRFAVRFNYSFASGTQYPVLNLTKFVSTRDDYSLVFFLSTPIVYSVVDPVVT